MRILLLFPILWLGQSPVVFGTNFRQSISNQELMKHGEKIYKARCIGCHGEKGDGKGLAAKFLDPKPRDFTTGVFKFKSTPYSSLPTDADLLRTITLGVAGTSMPNFSLLPQVSRFAVAQYIKKFSKLWKDPSALEAPLSLAPLPRKDFTDHKKFMVRAKAGRQVYILNCAVCHGLKGLGDGEGSEGLEDDWGFPIRPANLGAPSIKSGKSVKDIFRVLQTGLAGTPMPPFNDMLSTKELWDVSAYVLYLRGLKAGMYVDPPPIAPIKASELE